ncbi:MAG TPA: alcohol dehydrogenase catalytic domain-containing protein [Acidobacteriota bacterium]|nr:alcohol dehydrogenase catalytic domain-containing protein [Acidobacteriota bacterium]
MKAIVLNELGSVELEDFPAPEIQDPGDVIVRVTTSGICGSDLHIIHGRDPGIRMGTIMGHEFVGVIQECGNAVTNLKSGDRVVSPFTVNCGECFYCKRDFPARCVRSIGFGFVTEEGTGLHGGQAELVRVPMASSTLMKVPDKKENGDKLKDEDVLFLGDIFSTAYSTAEGAKINEGDTVVVVGCGPVGLLSILAAKLFGPSHIVAIDSVEYRLEKARSFGAITVGPDRNAVSKAISELTEGRGADAAIEAVGNPSALDVAIHAVRPGATVSIAGYHTEDVYEFPIQLAYRKNLTIRIGRCNAGKYMRQLLPLVLRNEVPITDIITHVLPLKEGLRGYDIFTNRKENAIKVLLKP